MFRDGIEVRGLAAYRIIVVVLGHPLSDTMVYDNLKAQLYAISLSGFVYGISLFSVFELTARLLRKRHKGLMDVQLLIFITFMFLLGTVAFAQGIFYLEHSGSVFLTGTNNATVNAVSSNEVGGPGHLNYFTRLGVPMSLPFTVLGANGLIVGRISFPWKR